MAYLVQQLLLDSAIRSPAAPALMIKTSGYRVSPTEIEKAIYGTRLVGEVAAFGIAHPTLARIEVRGGPLPRNPNGKIDRKSLSLEFAALAAGNTA